MVPVVERCDVHAKLNMKLILLESLYTRCHVKNSSAEIVPKSIDNSKKNTTIYAFISSNLIT